MKRKTTKQKKEMIVNWIDRMDALCDLYPEAVEEYMAYIEEGIEKDWPEALEAKGYACYGGNSIYECDWNESKKCLERLAELTEDPFCYNTLGYIYYYGRCNAGVPQYDEAFKCFSIGHACGVYESTYKLADMFMNGYGVPKNKRAAFELTNRIYDENLEIFQSGAFEGKFADIALRMGTFYEKGIGVEKSDLDAYTLFLQAKYAIDKRMECSNYYGDSKVKASIEKALKKAEGKIDPEFFIDELLIPVPGPVGDLLSNSDAVEISLKSKENKYYLVGKGIENEELGITGKALVTIPEFKQCKFINKAELLIVEPELMTRDMSDKLFATTIRYDEDNDIWEFIDGDKVVLSFRCKGFVYKNGK